MGWHRTSQGRLVGDSTLALLVAATTSAAAVTETTPFPLGGDTAIAGPRLVVVASYALAGLVLAVRRRVPLAALSAIAIVLGVPFLAFGASEGFGSVAAMFVALYTVGAYTRVGRAVVGLAIFTVFWAVLEIRDPLNPDLHSALASWPVYLLGVTLLLGGAFLRTRRLYVSELRARAEAAEADREARIRAATADERARIARELHDAVAHAMSVMVLQAEAADEILDVDPRRARLAIERVQRIGREGLSEMRRLLGVLRQEESPGLAPQPGMSALQALVDQVSAGGLPVHLRIDGEPCGLSAGVDISVYRIIQEALTNAIKHAGASTVDVRLRYGDLLELEVSDNGVAATTADHGHGLLGMRERVTLYGGTLNAGPMASGGFRVHATLPIERPS